jgi:hypothetical protein
MKNESLNDTYQFYFSNAHADCYYTTANGTCYRSENDAVETFLNSSYAYELYASTELPVLTTAATDIVIPYSVTWHYRTQKAFTQLLSANETSDILTYPIANDIAFYFSIQPSHHEVIIRRDGEELYRGTAEGISLSLQGQNDILDFEINTIYNQDSRLDYYGTLTYRFRMQVVEAARFSMNTLNLQKGGVFLLSCENVKNAQNLKIESFPALLCEPMIFQRNDRVYAAIPADVAEKLLRFGRAAVAVATMRGKSYLQIGSLCMGIAGSQIDVSFMEEYLGLRVESVDEVEVIRRMEEGIYDHEEYEKAMAWVKANCPEGFDKNPEFIRKSPEQKAKDWEFTVKTALIV